MLVQGAAPAVLALLLAVAASLGLPVFVLALLVVQVLLVLGCSRWSTPRPAAARSSWPAGRCWPPTPSWCSTTGRCAASRAWWPWPSSGRCCTS
jgi:hypothetical protein